MTASSARMLPGGSTVGSPAEAGVSADSPSSVRQASEEPAIWRRLLTCFCEVGGFPAQRDRRICQRARQKLRFLLEGARLELIEGGYAEHCLQPGNLLVDAFGQVRL